MEPIVEKNKPTNAKLWARAKSLAKSKFDVYPSAYANGWAAKWYRSKGGGWRSTNEELGKDNEWGRPELTQKMLAATPGQENADIPPAKVKSLKEFWMMCDTLAKYDNNIELKAPSNLPKQQEDDMDEYQRKYKVSDYSAENDYEREETGGETSEYDGIEEAAPAWQRKEGKNPEGGLNRKGIASYRRENPGSKLSMAVTTKPSKLKKGSKAAKRRKSFCARMGGMKKRLTSAKTANDPDSRINKALRKWNC